MEERRGRALEKRRRGRVSEKVVEGKVSVSGIWEEAAEDRS